MSETIPEDVMKTAREAVSQAFSRDKSLEEFAKPIARALMAERERAARIAEDAGDTWSDSFDVNVCIRKSAVDEKCIQIAAAIRNAQP